MRPNWMIGPVPFNACSPICMLSPFIQTGPLALMLIDSFGQFSLGNMLIAIHSLPCPSGHTRHSIRKSDQRKFFGGRYCQTNTQFIFEGIIENQLNAPMGSEETSMCGYPPPRPSLLSLCEQKTQGCRIQATVRQTTIMNIMHDNKNGGKIPTSHAVMHHTLMRKEFKLS